MLLANFKTAARKKAKTVRAKAHREMGYVASQAVCSHINNFVINEKNFKVIAVYMPIQTEIDILPVIPRIRELGKILCLPNIISDNEPLDFLAWNENSKLVKGKFGVMVPETDKIVDPDLILCPMLSFDARGYRLGYGGGFYDRTIHHLASQKSIFTLGCAFSEQISLGALPIGKYDKPLNAVVTENGVTFFDI